jgi:hypothetical protein
MELPGSLCFVETLYGAGDLTTVKASENGSDFVVQSLEPEGSAFALDEAEAASGTSEAVASFIAGKKREARVAETSEYFVKGRIERVGETDYWVRPFLSSSLRERVSLKDSFDAGRLSGICVGIAKALADLEAFDGSGHGRLSLGNVLLAEGSGIRVRLVDPARPDAGHGTRDRRALGLIIYQLFHGEFVELDQALTSVPEDEDWHRLGRNGQRWKQFCDELLSPVGGYSQCSWEEIRKELESLASGGGGKGKLAILVVFLLIAAGGGAFFFKWGSDVEEIVVDPATIQGKWLELLDHYFDWGGSFLLSENEYTGDRSSGGVWELFYDEEGGLAAFRVIADVTGAGRRLLDEPASIRPNAMAVDALSLDEDLQKRIVVAHRYFDDLRGKIENWDVLARLRRSRESFAEVGFDYGLRETDRLLADISFEDGNLTLQALDQLQKEAAGLSDFQKAYDSLMAALGRLREFEAGRFPSLYADALEAQLNRASDAPVQNLRNLSGQARELVQFLENLGPKFDLEQLQAAEADFLAREGMTPVDPSSAGSWRSWAAGYSRLDPALSAETRERLLASSREVLELDERINELREPDMEVAAFRVKADSIVAAFDAATDLPAIELNRPVFEAAVTRSTSEMSTLLARASLRLDEVNPEIGPQLRFLAGNVGELREPLLGHWQDYLDEAIRPLSEERFSSPIEFIRFRRGEREKLARFEDFQETYLAPLQLFESSAINQVKTVVWRDEATGHFAATKAQLLRDWATEVAPQLLAGAVDFGEQDVVASQKRRQLEQISVDLGSYFRRLEETEAGLADWRFPEEGLADRLRALAESDLARIPAVERAVQRISVYEDIAKSTDSSILFRMVTDPSRPLFLRFIALQSLTQTLALAPAQIAELAPILSAARSAVPPERDAAWKSVVAELWTMAFTDPGLTGAERQSVLELRQEFLENTGELPPEARFLVEVGQSIEELKTNMEHYLEQPVMLEEVLQGLRRAASPLKAPRIRRLIDELEAVDLDRKEPTFDEIGPVAAGWSIESRTDERLVLAWNGRRLPFLRFEAEAGDFFLAAEEVSLALFGDWMTQRGLWDQFADDIPGDWQIFVSQTYDSMDDWRQGLRPWTIDRRGLNRGVAPAATWYEVDPMVRDEYRARATIIRGDSFPNEDLPIQHVGARLAKAFAQSAGMDLPTPEQWEAAVTSAPQLGNLWQSNFDDELSEELAAELQLGSFYTEAGIVESGAAGDRPLLLEPVTGDGGLRHLCGNVAEYLFAPDQQAFYVAGGSALAAVAGTWMETHRLTPRQEQAAYSDVGFRLAFSAPDASAYEQFLESLQRFWR